jgi:Fe-S-cluster containining protein
MRFECQPGCTNCCRQKGFVYLTEDDLLRAAAFLKMAPAEFEKRYVYRTRHLRRLRVPRRSQCHFLRADGCSIHPAKPAQCSIFPFWPELVNDPAEWRKTAAWCPGIGKGKLIQIRTARALSDAMRSAHPELY